MCSKIVQKYFVKKNKTQNFLAKMSENVCATFAGTLLGFAQTLMFVQRLLVQIFGFARAQMFVQRLLVHFWGLHKH